jgi:uncharacterized protein (DUF58 family)
VSGTALQQATPEFLTKSGVVKASARIARGIILIVLSPLRFYISVRNSMTGSSVTLLLVGIVSMNIVWGYPWGGVFSACGALMLVGWAINQFMRPNLKIEFSLPNSATAGQSFVVVTHACNRSRMPAMDLSISFAVPKRHRKRRIGLIRRKAARDTAAREKAAHEDYRASSQPQTVPLIHPVERIDLSGSFVFEQRGIHPLPDVVVTSMFPFHLFRSTCHHSSETCIAVTPRLMTGEEDAVARGLLNSLGGWSHKLLSGDALDYSGSREYEVGMPVRRWDFASWARIGRPIVREFQSPSIQSVVLIVDTSTGDVDAADTDGELFERLLSLAATAATELTRRMIRVRLYVTSESATQLAAANQAHWATDSESLLMRLAAAESVPASDADSFLHTVLQHEGRCPLLVLTARENVSLEVCESRSVTTLRVDPSGSPEQTEPALRMQ